MLLVYFRTRCPHIIINLKEINHSLPKRKSGVNICLLKLFFDGGGGGGFGQGGSMAGYTTGRGEKMREGLDGEKVKRG